MEHSTTGRLLALDMGERTIGLAVSDELGLTAQPLEVLRRRNEEDDLGRVIETAERLGVREFVVGLPRNMNGTFGPSALACQAFAAVLQEKSGLPVHLVDERLTTVAAHRALIEADVSRARRRQVVDATAAALILGIFMEGRRRRESRDGRASE